MNLFNINKFIKTIFSNIEYNMQTIISNSFVLITLYIVKLIYDYQLNKKMTDEYNKKLKNNSVNLSQELIDGLVQVLKENNIDLKKFKKLKFFNTNQFIGFSSGNNIYINENYFRVNESKKNKDTAIGVLLHEIKHIQNKDMFKSFIMERFLVISNLFIIIYFYINNTHDYKILSLIFLITIIVSFLINKKFTRFQETEADKYSYKLLKKGVINYFYFNINNENNNIIRNLFSDYPSWGKRIKNLQSI